MPVRSLNDRVLRWPDAATVRSAAIAWAERTAARHADVQSIGYFGSYARGDWSVGSDLDVIVVVDDDGPSSEKRALAFDMPRMPVPVDLLVYTVSEWKALRSARMQRVADEMVWIKQNGCKPE